MCVCVHLPVIYHLWGLKISETSTRQPVCQSSAWIVSTKGPLALERLGADGFCTSCQKSVFICMTHVACHLKKPLGRFAVWLTILVELSTTGANGSQNRQGRTDGRTHRKEIRCSIVNSQISSRLWSSLKWGWIFSYVIRYADPSSPSRRDDGPRMQPESLRQLTHL